MECGITTILKACHSSGGCLAAGLCADTIKGKTDLGDALRINDAHRYCHILAHACNRLCARSGYVEWNEGGKSPNSYGSLSSAAIVVEPSATNFFEKCV